MLVVLVPGVALAHENRSEGASPPGLTWAYKGGYYKHIGEGRWVEGNSEGIDYHFRERGPAGAVELVDLSRDYVTPARPRRDPVGVALVAPFRYKPCASAQGMEGAMLTWLGTVAWLVVLAGPPLAGQAMTLQWDGEWQQARRFGQVPGRLAGRLVGAFIREGMTQQQTDRLLGNDPWHSGSSFFSGSFFCEHRVYHRYGLSLCFCNWDKGCKRASKALLVDGVYFLPLMPRPGE
jgi:hypothetical protein